MGQWGLAVEGDRAGKELKQDNSGRIDIGSRGNIRTRNLLGGEIADGADDLTRAIVLRLGGAHQAEIADLNAVVVRDENVVWLDIAVHEAGVVDLGEPGQHGVHDPGRGMWRHGSAFSKELAQGAAGDELHDEIDG